MPMMAMKITAMAGRLELDKKRLRATMRSAGGEIKAKTEALLSNAGGGGRWYRGVSASPYRPEKAGRYQASAPGAPPVKVSGQLAGSIVVRVFRSGEGVAIRSKIFYAKFMETGARNGGGNARASGNVLRAGERNAKGRVLRGRNRLKKSATMTGRVLLPRPFLSAALDQAEATFRSRIETAINDGLKFQRKKVKS